MEKFRDTDADWVELSAIEPYYNILTAPQFLTENLNEEQIASFFASGEENVKDIVSRIEFVLGEKFVPNSAVDFGCGVGRLVFPMRQYAQHVTGVDVSPHMLKRAEHRRDQLNAIGIEFRHDIPEDGGFDWVNSFLVFQHIPPERGYGLLARLLACLRVGGVASIHLTAYREPRHFHPSYSDIGLLRFDGHTLDVIESANDMSVGKMMMYDFDLGKVVPLFVAAGIGSLHLEHIDHAGIHAFWIVGRKSS
jgi:SAM-dependent methyltransferase